MPGLRRRLERPQLANLSQVQRLGVLRPDGMGDIVMTTGMLRELRRQLPQTQIVVICQARWASWLRTCPWMDDVIEVDVTSAGWSGHPKRLWQLARFIRRVWPLDLEVLLQPGTAYWYVHSRALAWFTGAPVRVCWEDPDSGVDTGGAFHTHRLRYANSWHETDKCFRMLEAIGLQPQGRRLETWWTPEEAWRGQQIASKAKRRRDRLVALGLAASEPSKRWPRERYLEVIREVAARRDVAFLALGGRDVADSCRWLAEQAGGLVVDGAADLPLGVVWAAIAQCDLYLGNDTGLAHMAAAARVPVVVVCGVPQDAPPGTFGDPSHTGPHDTRVRVVRPSAQRERDSTPDPALVAAEAVTGAALELLS